MYKSVTAIFFGKGKFFILQGRHNVNVIKPLVFGANLFHIAVKICKVKVVKICFLRSFKHKGCAYDINMRFGADFTNRVDKLAIIFNRSVNAAERNVVNTQANENIFGLDFGKRFFKRSFFSFIHRVAEALVFGFIRAEGKAYGV